MTLPKDFFKHPFAHRDLGMPVVAKLKDDGVPVACWTVRSEAEEVRAREVADQVTFEGYLADIG